MAINVERQRAFSAAFNQYPDILAQFATNHVKFVTPDNRPFVPADRERMTQHVMELLLAQYITRLFQTRARNSDSERMKEFAEFTVARYKQLTMKYIGALSMTAEDKYRKALNHIEAGMAQAIFAALAEEAEIDTLANDNGKDNSQFDEADFWHDIMLALGSYYRKGRHPRWWIVTQYMYLDHKKEFSDALKEENEVAGRTENNQDGPSSNGGLHH